MTKNGPASESTPLPANGASAAHPSKAAAAVVSSIEGKAVAAKLSDHAASRNTDAGTNGNAADDDTEAETDIEPGNEAGPRTLNRRSIKHEGKGDALRNGQAKTNGVSDRKPKPDSDDSEQLDRPAGDNSNSSILTSAVSSPSAIDDQSSQAGSSGSPQSPSKTSVDSDTLARGPTKRKRESDEGHNHENKRRVKREASAGLERSVTKKQRSSSPPLRQRRRTLSTQTAILDHAQKSGRRKSAHVNTGQDEAEPSSDDSETRHYNRHRKSIMASNSSASVKPRITPTINTFRFRDKSGRTIVAKACSDGDLKAVRVGLKDNPSHLNVTEHAGNTPLQIAALDGDTEIVKFLINQGADVHTKNVDKDTPLIDAVENGHFEVVELLLNAGVNPFQANSRGQEPLELNQESSGTPEARQQIEVALLNAKERWNSRRPSEPGDQQSSRDSAALQSPRGSPSVATLSRQNTNMASRRAPRGTSTRNDLLWIQPTADRLKRAAGEGDDEAVSFILSMEVKASTHAVLAAAKGCHQTCLDMLIALGEPEVDPDPLPGTAEGRGTPLLAAIGQSGENIDIIKTLLNQAGFDPTRKLFENKTYYQLAKEREGPNAEAEYSLLKAAYDNFLKKGGSPKTSRTSGTVKRQKRPEAASPRSTRQEANESHKDTGITTKRTSNATQHRKGSNERPSSSNSHLQVPSKLKSRESSVAVSDRAESPSARDKRRRIASDSEDNAKAPSKPRKRLLTGKERREDEERKQRRSSITSVDSTASNLKRGTNDLRKSKIRGSPSPTRGQGAASHKRDAESLKMRSKRTSKVDPEATHGAGKSSTTATGPKTSKPGRKEPQAESSTAQTPNAHPHTTVTATATSDTEHETKKRDSKQGEEQKNMDEEPKRPKVQYNARDIIADAQAKTNAMWEEQDRKRKEKEKEEAEEQARQAEAQALAAEQARRMQADRDRLPNGLFHAKYNHSTPPTAHDLKWWTPVMGITTANLAKQCPTAREHAPDEAFWMHSIQAAVLLGLKDTALAEEVFKDCPQVKTPLTSSMLGSVKAWFLQALTPPKEGRGVSPTRNARFKTNGKKWHKLAEEGHPFFFLRCEDLEKALAGRPSIPNLMKDGRLHIRKCNLMANCWLKLQTTSDDKPDLKLRFKSTTAEKPSGDKPSDDNPSGDKLSDDKPTDDMPTDDKPSDDKPADDNNQDKTSSNNKT